MKRAKRTSELEEYLASIGGSRKTMDCRKKAIVFSQGGPADALFYILRGRVKLSILSGRGKEAVIGILDAGEFVGINCLMGQKFRQMSATAITSTTILRIGREEMQQALQAEPALMEQFIRYVVHRKVQMEAKLADNLSFSSEKRLARALLLLAQRDLNGGPDAVIPKVSQETLAAMIGTTRSRVSYFMNKFKKQGFIEYNKTFKVNRSLSSAVQSD